MKPELIKSKMFAAMVLKCGELQYPNGWGVGSMPFLTKEGFCKLVETLKGDSQVALVPTGLNFRAAALLNKMNKGIIKYRTTTTPFFMV